jgi:hypothetical protein
MSHDYRPLAGEVAAFCTCLTCFAAVHVTALDDHRAWHASIGRRVYEALRDHLRTFVPDARRGPDGGPERRASTRDS